MMTTNKLGLYIHIPFCVRKCNYCAFNSVGICSFGEESDVKRLFREYTDALKKETAFYAGFAKESYEVDTVFIGGGTPSVIPAVYIEEILEEVKKGFRISENPEITMECNPGTLSNYGLDTYVKLGINRISMGVQSFDDKLLGTLGRIHDSKTAKESFRLLRDAGFENINLDLMFSIPGHDKNIWRSTLSEACGLEPEHISFYSLQLEENTPFFDMFERGEIQLPTDELDREMYHEAISMLKENGYEHYEISNAAKPGKKCRHNLKYWSLDEYIGLGAGAHSYFRGFRFFNREDVREYIAALSGEIGTFSAENGAFDAESERLLKTADDHEEEQHISGLFAPCAEKGEIVQNTKSDDMSEFVFTGLRRTDGISLSEFSKRFGSGFSEVYRECMPKLYEYEKQGFVSLENDSFLLTEKGIDISNSIMALFV